MQDHVCPLTVCLHVVFVHLSAQREMNVNVKRAKQCQENIMSQETPPNSGEYHSRGIDLES